MVRRGATAVVVLGDVALDVRAAMPEALRPGGDVPAAIRIGVGGQAANVAVRLARRGVRARLAAPIGDDAPGNLLRELLVAEGAKLVLSPMRSERSSLVIALIDSRGERSMLSDRVPLSAGALTSVVDGARWVHCSGYVLADDRTGDGLAAILAALPDGVRRSVAGGSLAPDPERARRMGERLRSVGATLVVFDLEEARALLADAGASPELAVRTLAQEAEIAVVTAGGAGSWLACGDRILRFPAPSPAGEVIDTTGAGDAYVAALIAALAEAPIPPDADLLHDALASASLLGARVARVAGAQGRVEGEELPA